MYKLLSLIPIILVTCGVSLVSLAPILIHRQEVFATGYGESPSSSGVTTSANITSDNITGTENTTLVQ
jgi:hypothetical protein